MFGYKWKFSSTFIECPKLSGRIKISNLLKKFNHIHFSECPDFLGSNDFFNLYLWAS
jgi:hypothetical protein